MSVVSENALRGGTRAYRHVIFDADDTLLRYRDDERGAFSRLFARHNVAADDELLAFSNAVSERIWTETGLYDVHSPAIQREYHTLYRAHVEHVFAEIIGYLATRGFFVQGADAKKWRDEFLKELETGGNLMDGAAETLTELRRRGYAVSIATNGLTAIQIGRTKPLFGLFDNLFVSEALCAIKPTAEFFRRLLAGLGAKKEDCLFVGDSLASDVAGANGAGIDCCLFDPCGKYSAGGNAVGAGNAGVKRPCNAAPDYTITRLTDLLRLL